MNIEIDGDRCVASGQCVMLVPTIFDQDDDGTVVLLKNKPSADEEPGVIESIRVCPASAIAALNEGGE
jgi:ferredoxin